MLGLAGLAGPDSALRERSPAKCPDDAQGVHGFCQGRVEGRLQAKLTLRNSIHVRELSMKLSLYIEDKAN